MEIIDTHVHIYPPEIIDNAEKIAQKEPYFAQLIKGKVHRWATYQDLLSVMDQDNIAESWVCGFGFMDLGLCKLCNDYSFEAVVNSKGRLKAMAVIPPMDRGMESEIIRCAEKGIIGVGEIFPDGQQWNIDDRRQTWRLAALCDEYNLFALIHTAEPVGHDYPGKGTVGPREIVNFCLHHPEMHTIFAHWGGGAWIYEYMPELRQIMQNAWYDTAASPFLYTPAIFNLALQSSVSEKILYGSDYPLLRIGRFPAPEELSQTLPNAEDIFGINAKKLLKKLNK